MKLAAQLYTLRDFTKTRDDFREVLNRCANIGYEGVQLSAVGCMSGDSPEVGPEEAKKMLDAVGLACCATHRSWADLSQQTVREIEFHRILDCTYTALGGIGHEFGVTTEAYERFLVEAQPVAHRLWEAGIRFGYHNHSHEFIRNEKTGRPNFEILDDRKNEWLQMEIDTYWVAHAGASPEGYLRRSDGRIWAVHLKDMEVVEKDGPVMAPVGDGNLDWDEILAACSRGGTQWLIVEQDVCRRDPYDCLRSSYDFLTARLA